MYSIRKFLAFYSHFQATSGQMTSLLGHFWSPEVTWRLFCHVTASYCKLPLCRKWNVQYTRVFGLIQPLPGDFRSNNVTSGSLPVTLGHVTSFPVRWLPPTASYSIAGSEMYSIRKFLAFYSHFQVTSGPLTSLLGHFQSPDITWRHFLSGDCNLLRATALQEVNAQNTRVFGLLQPLLGEFQSKDVTSGHLRSRDISFCHGNASYCEL